MKKTEEVVVPGSTEEVPMVEQEVVLQMRALAEAGWGVKRIAREVGVARNTVRRYLREGEAADKQERPRARQLREEEQRRAVELWDTTAERNAVVVQALLAREGVEASVRTVQRAVFRVDSAPAPATRSWTPCSSRSRTRSSRPSSSCSRTCSDRTCSSPC